MIYRVFQNSLKILQILIFEPQAENVSPESHVEYENVQHKSFEERNSGISSSVLEISPIEESPDLET